MKKEHTLAKKHCTITVFGKVQGVWFRKYTKAKAIELHINGFVRNKPNNTVYIEAEGSDETMQLFIEWLYTGSPLSKVVDVSCIWSEELKDFKNFKIER